MGAAEENETSIRWAKKIQKFAKVIGFRALASACEDYLASFSDEKYDVLESTLIYKLFTGKEAEAVYLGKCLHISHFRRGQVIDFRFQKCFSLVVEGKVGVRLGNLIGAEPNRDPLIAVFEEEDHFHNDPKGNSYNVAMEENTTLLWLTQDSFKRFARNNRKKHLENRLPDAMHAMGMLNIENCLHRVPFFKSTMFEINIPVIATMCKIELYQKDDPIVKQGLDIDSFMFNVCGFCKLGIEDDGKENTFKDRTPYDVLSNCVEMPMDTMELKDSQMPEEEYDDEWLYRYQNDTLFGAMTRAELDTKKQKPLPDLYSYNTRSTRIPSRIISNYLDVNMSANVGRSGPSRFHARKRDVFPAHLQELLPREDDLVTENFKKGNYEGSWMTQGRKGRVATKPSELKNAMIGPGSHFYSLEMIGNSVKKSRFSLLSVDWSLYIRLPKKHVQNFLKLPGQRDINYRYFKNLRRNDNQFEEKWKKMERKKL
jgi:hypothetical protein